MAWSQSLFQSTRPLRGATDGFPVMALQAWISIHAPLAGRDLSPISPAPPPRYFNPRAPCGARPTRSLSRGVRRRDFNPRAPCGARPRSGGAGRILPAISIHAPLAGRDMVQQCQLRPLSAFQSTRPLRGATQYSDSRLVGCQFQSTRPLRGATSGSSSFVPTARIFQSTRPLRGATAQVFYGIVGIKQFQSTRPLRGAT